jgi:alpha-glucosidase
LEAFASTVEVRVSRWWQGAVGYQIYIRSFADGDGDGVGDLAGIRARLPYLADLGVDVLWITPFYPSPQADHGYDVSDHTDVDPLFGTLADVERTLAEAHELGLRVVVDLVPNHSSDQHPWFQDALTGRDAQHRDRYVWRDGAPDGGPPNNWVSYFGGPAWSYHQPTDQWWMHLFLPEQPDLNWADPGVREAFLDVLRFWSELGVDGFRVDVAHSLVEHPEFPDNPLRGDPPPHDASPGDVWDAYDHLHDQDQPEIHDIYRSWSEAVAPYDGVLLGEVYLRDVDRVARYVHDGGLHLAFCFPALHVPWDAGQLRDVLEAGVAAGGDAFAWPLSSHDDPHAASRFGGGDPGARRSLAYFTLLSALPGVPFLFQGDELGLDDGRPETEADPIAVRNPGASGRDGSRTPMIWEPGPGHGFTTGEPWLPFGRDDADARAASVQEGDQSSPLERTRTLLAARRELPDLRGDLPVTWLDLEGPLVALRRGGTTVVLHAVADPADPSTDAADGSPSGGAPRTTAVDPQPIELEVGASELAFASADGARVEDGCLTLPPDCTAILVDRGARS